MSEKDTDGTGEPSDGQMAAKIILLVSDSNDSKFGEIIVLDEIRKAESAIEALLEAGLEQARVRVFTRGRRATFRSPTGRWWCLLAVWRIQRRSPITGSTTRLTQK